jgi:hypothetical protein
MGKAGLSDFLQEEESRRRGEEEEDLQLAM